MGSEPLLCRLPGESISRGVGWKERGKEGGGEREQEDAYEWELAISRTLLPHFPDGESEANCLSRSPMVRS